MPSAAQYRVVVGEHVQDVTAWDSLAAQVNSLIKDGWQPLGGIAIDSGQLPNGQSFAIAAQGMVKVAG